MAMVYNRALYSSAVKNELYYYRNEFHTNNSSMTETLLFYDIKPSKLQHV